jgi:Phage integrase family
VARLARDPEVEALIDAYRTDLVAAGHFAENEVTSPARAFLLRIGGPSGPASLREPWLFMDRGRRLGPESVRTAVQKVAREAGLGNVTPHQLRHTLATQAINRGMSLEAIAALLGHRSMRMTMVYAKISNRTVADEYFKVSAQVEALYDAPKQLPPEAEGIRDAQAPLRDAPADARQRVLRPPRRAGLPLRIDLRIVHLLSDHARVPPDPPAPT